VNTLSWLILVADWAYSIKPLFGATAGLCVLLLCVVAFAWVEGHPDARPALKKSAKRIVAIGLVSLFVCVAIPHRFTILALAASEAGEAVATSPEGVDVLDDLKAIIKKRLKEELGGDE